MVCVFLALICQGIVILNFTFTGKIRGAEENFLSDT
jgi:hypothetical protein